MPCILDNDTGEEDDDDDNDDDTKLPMTAKKMTDKTTPKHTSTTTDNEVTVTKVTKPDDTLPVHDDSDDGDDPDEDNKIESIKQCEENPDEDEPMEMEQTTVDTTKKDQQQGMLDPFFDGSYNKGTSRYAKNREITETIATQRNCPCLNQTRNSLPKPVPN